METSFLFLNFLGTGEFVLIAFVFLLLFGPDKIPGIARNLAKGIRRIKDASNDIKHEIHESSNCLDSVSSEIKNDIKELHEVTKSVKRDINKTLDK
tara:strand:+ start:1583 stop:1870 length:288 start_codon:yes stop_codon:yes gene_type:complete